MEEKYIAVQSVQKTAVESDGKALLIPFINPAIGKRKPAVIVCPGGGYSMIAPMEAEPVALRFQSCGMQAFLLRYSVGKENPYPKALRELAFAIRHIREHAVEYNVDPAAIVVCGMSAGGHLAASIGVHGNATWTNKYGFPDSCRPDALVLCYPVTAEGGKETKTYQLMREGMKDKKLEQYLHVDRYVSKDTPQTFLWHTVDDDMVSAADSLVFLQALQQSGVSYESHFFPDGGHMLSLADESTARDESQINETCAQWFPLALRWIRRKVEAE